MSLEHVAGLIITFLFGGGAVKAWGTYQERHAKAKWEQDERKQETAAITQARIELLEALKAEMSRLAARLSSVESLLAAQAAELHEVTLERNTYLREMHALEGVVAELTESLNKAEASFAEEIAAKEKAVSEAKGYLVRLLGLYRKATGASPRSGLSLEDELREEGLLD